MEYLLASSETITFITHFLMVRVIHVLPKEVILIFFQMRVITRMFQVIYTITNVGLKV